MPRAITAAMEAELEKSEIRPAFFIEIQSVTTFRFWSGLHDIVWNAVTWEPQGLFKGIESVPESLDSEAPGLTVEWAGEQAMTALLNDLKYGDLVKYWFALIDDNGAVIPDPLKLYEGKLDTTELDDRTTESTIKLNFENSSASQMREEEFRYNQATQQRFFPNDIGFEYLTYLQKFSATWANKKKKRQRKKNKAGN